MENSETKEKKGKKKSVDLKENPTIVFEIDKDEDVMVRYPDQDIPESEKDAQWYLNNIRYISSFYNVAFESVLAPQGTNVAGPAIQTNLLNARDLPVNRMLRYMTYYQGRQENIDYNDWAALTTDGESESGSAEGNYQPHWIKGQDIAELINFMKGNILERISNLQITAKALSEEAASEMQNLRSQLMLKHKYKDVFNELKVGMGIEYNVGPKEGFENEGQIDDFMEKNFKQQGVEVATAMAKNFWYQNFCLHKFLNLFTMTCITGVAATHHYIQNGKQYMKTVPSWQMILDTRHDDDYNRDAQFVGIAETMTPSEVFVRFPQLTKEQREEIKKMARSRDLGARYNSAFANFNWWNYNVKRDECVVTVVTAYWMGMHDMGLKKGKNKYQVEKIMRTEKDEKGSYVFEDIYKGTLIGNRYLVEWGLDDNIVEDYKDKSRPQFPIIRYLPNMIGGEPRSIVSRLYQLQDEIDALKYKVRESIGRANGKVYIIRNVGGNDMDLEELYKDFKTMGLSVVTPSGEGEQEPRLAEMLDYTLDPNIMRIEEIVKINRDLMKEYTSINNVSLGMTASYMGMGERNSVIGQSSYGLASLYHGFMDFIQMNLQYAVNISKSLYTLDGDTEAAFVVGDKGVQYLKVMADMKFEDFLVILQLNDMIDEQGKKNIQQLALAWSQNGIVDPDVYLSLLNEQTYTGARKFLEQKVKEKKKEQMEQRQQQMQHEQQIAAQNSQALKQAEALRQAGQDGREHIKAQAKVDVAHINKMPEPGQETNNPFSQG